MRHLVFALADIQGRGASATIVYLEDQMPLSAELKERLRDGFADISVIYDLDSTQIAAFSGLPAPGLLKRNLRLDWSKGMIPATEWSLPILEGARFDVGYIYHPGLFCSKAASSSCDRTVMRESGLNNYVSFPVKWPKAIVRKLMSLPPFRQVWGEERWIDAIEVSRPTELPTSVREKADRLTFSDLLAGLSADQARHLGSVFIPSPPKLAAAVGPRAILLTQPLDKVGLCTAATKQATYQQIVDVLSNQGFHVYVKHHPSDAPFPLEKCFIFDQHFPVELLPTLDLPRFDLAVAICSASLIEGRKTIAEKNIQLLPSKSFTVAGLAQWQKGLPANLITIIA